MRYAMQYSETRKAWIVVDRWLIGTSLARLAEYKSTGSAKFVVNALNNWQSFLTQQATASLN